MSIWDLRQAIESAIPAWLPIVVLIGAVAVVCYGIWTRGINGRRKR